MMQMKIAVYSFVALVSSGYVSAHTISVDPPSPMPTPPAGPMGILFVQPSDTTLSGYVAATRDDQGRYVVTKDIGLALPVAYADNQIFPLFGAGYTNIGATFGEVYQSPPEGPGINAFEGNSYNFAALTGTGGGKYGEAAHTGQTSYVRNDVYESALFRLDPQNNEILPTWINPDGSPKPSTFGISGDGGPLEDSPLFVSMNIGSFNAIYKGFSARIFLVDGPTPPPVSESVF